MQSRMMKQIIKKSVKLDDEGCYEVTAQVKDSEGNFTDITLNVYVDGTATGAGTECD